MKLYEINELVAEKVMGWEYEPETDTFIISRNEDGINCLDANPLGDHYFSPTINIKDAWLVVEKLRGSRVFSLHDAWDEEDKPIFSANFQYNDGYHVIDYQAYGETAPLAICLAGLKAVGVEVEG